MMNWNVDTSLDLEAYHEPCPALKVEAYFLAGYYAGRPSTDHTDQGYPLRGGRFYVTDNRTRKWERRPSVTVVVRIDGREGIATAAEY